MRLVVLSLFCVAATLYSLASFHSYREELFARDGETAAAPVSSEPPLHPEANLKRLRAAFAAGEYSDDLEPLLERALTQAPTFYQPPFLLAAFYANRLEKPETIERSFEAALARFPSNGRLHLTYAEWLLTPRANAPYRSYRSDAGDEGKIRERALAHVERATSLEPDLVRRSLDLMRRARVSVASWAEVLPTDATTRQLILHAVDRAPRDRRARRHLLATYLAEAGSTDILRAVSTYGRKWSEPELALTASEEWHRRALQSGAGPELTRATVSLSQGYLDAEQSERAYRVMRETLSAMEERGLEADSADLLVEMGDAYLARRQRAMAESLFTEAATRFPFHAPAYLGLAHVYQRSGDHDGAVRELRRVLELDPNDNQARSLLDAMSEPR